MEKHNLSEYTLPKHDYGEIKIITCFITKYNLLSLSYTAEISWKASGNVPSRNRSSLQLWDATRIRLEGRIPEGILLTTHDHALLTENFPAQALG